ncbi:MULTISPECIES: ribose 5-phosphate isomerase B [unclassified Lactobacillus]|uniref:ribose 5-phosphate isomerase B n=1 Tax=unclassified Lactobacillus TaxID=2620435 RepID=UPI000EFD8E05|nr:MULTISPECIES: ribose 5-phosphate isomerase B [unclassified Lactobacillus]RMC23873.1 ribose 5-phosphate isomerase B [Lactobacillus sp. ESL0247]RMC27617.1 ribose 5-phosphate isomerase B [Lactobacillus sp. ESL0246]RMC30897.1 ribose 5-phosphate isomerase B [Lactobacillus sp. ESL0245]
MKNLKIAFGSDHVGYELKPVIMEYVKSLGYEIYDFGTYSNKRTDYPIYGKKVGEEVAAGNYDLGIVICGTGVGISIAANKVSGIRAACVSEPYSAELSRRHNNSNILAFGSRVVGSELAKMIVKSWLDAEFEGGRHQRRIDELAAEDTHDNQKFDKIKNNITEI